MPRLRYLIRFVGLLLAVQIGAVLVTLWAHGVAALGAHSESVQLADSYAPGMALLAVAWFAARERRMREGFYVAAGTVGVWLLVFLFLSTRFIPEFWADARPTLSHLEWWLGALALGMGGGWLGARFSSYKVGISGGFLLLLGLSARQLWWGENLAESLAPFHGSDGNPIGLGSEGDSGEAMPVKVESDGTSVFVLHFDIRKISFDLADADWDDSHPFDNRNATWLGNPQDRVWRNLEAQHHKRLVCLVNGGFFGAQTPYIAQHEAPILHDGIVRYPVSTLQHDWPDQEVTLAWKRVNGVLTPRIVRGMEPQALKAQFDGALGGVRVLIENGKLAPLRPGMGGTTLKCSRTSVAWNRTDFAVLSVRDPDGEASSLRQNRRERNGERGVQVGGWDAAQVQAYWKSQGFPNAVLFDGGESAQISVRLPWEVRSTQSSYHFTRTLGFWNGRPLRAVWPLWPPTMANGGVLNWFAIVEAD